MYSKPKCPWFNFTLYLVSIDLDQVDINLQLIGIDQLLVDFDLQLVGIDQQLAYIWLALTKDEARFDIKARTFWRNGQIAFLTYE